MEIYEVTPTGNNIISTESKEIPQKGHHSPLTHSLSAKLTEGCYGGAMGLEFLGSWNGQVQLNPRTIWVPLLPLLNGSCSWPSS